jgi:hypothetical protein
MTALVRAIVIVNDRPMLSSEGMYIRTITAKGSVGKKIMVVGLKGLGAKMN